MKSGVTRRDLWAGASAGVLTLAARAQEAAGGPRLGVGFLGAGGRAHRHIGMLLVGDWGERGMPIDDKNAQTGDALNWEEFLGDAPQRPFDVIRYFRWRMYEDYAGGPSSDLFPHSFTPVIDILGLTFPCRAVGTGGKVPIRGARGARHLQHAPRLRRRSSRSSLL